MEKAYQDEYTNDEPEVTNTVHNESFFGCISIIRIGVPEADQQVRS
jgi:hypothetical protein